MYIFEQRIKTHPIQCAGVWLTIYSLRDIAQITWYKKHKLFAHHII